MLFKDHLRRQKNENGRPLSNAAYGRRIGVTPTTVLRLANGQVPTPETMLAIFEESRGKVRPIDWYPAILEARKRMRGR